MEKNLDKIEENREATETKEENNKNVPACCVGCLRWEKFGKSCYYYWEGKKHCTVWIGSWDDAMMQQPL